MCGALRLLSRLKGDRHSHGGGETAEVRIWVLLRSPWGSKSGFKSNPTRGCHRRGRGAEPPRDRGPAGARPAEEQQTREPQRARGLPAVHPEIQS